MNAVRLHAFGPAENLSYERTPRPVPAPGQVRIAVAAAGVHLLDTALRQGVQGPPAPLPELPTIPGREVAGTVDALGPGTDPAWLGRPVVVHLGFAPGGYAEYAVADAQRLHPIPPGLDPAEAVAMIGTGRTALGLLAPGARHLVFGWSDGPLALTDAERAGLTARGITTQSVLGPVMLRRAGGDDPLRLLETRALAEAAAGRLRPALQRYPLSEAAAAHRALETRGTIGKVVLEP
ncbi:alcohol dehydrogenase catalytic domain-containing protein [Streptomyces goshikiensis]|uniref:alcohol dehydrogenase catalytic domain-containing protein n=1 Tax=Streptomyces goshikiensis TaxID=1942 RepID=UPI002ADF0F0C|nr:zinc-binding dehydrogenase [Streptomyces goshikiensis]